MDEVDYVDGVDCMDEVDYVDGVDRNGDRRGPDNYWDWYHSFVSGAFSTRYSSFPATSACAAQKQPPRMITVPER